MKFDYLRQFITISQEGTLTQAAEKLHVSQSTLTRNMYTLERLLGAKLFERSPNHIELTQTGQFALPKFQKLLSQHQELIIAIKAFEEGERSITGRVCSQGPLWKIKQNHEEYNEAIKLDVRLAEEETLFNQLSMGDVDFIVTSFPLDAAEVISCFYCQEQLYLSVPEGHALYHWQKVSFADLSGHTLLLRTDLGIWQQVIDSLTDINFIVQDRETFDRLIGNFSLPAFTTNISQEYQLGDARKHIPIMDGLSRKDYYLSYLAKDQDKVAFLLDDK